VQLIKLRLKNFRRFAGDHGLDLNEDLIALVGPNEAGKSSLLFAIDLLGRRESPSVSDVTRGHTDPAHVAGLYVLDDDDRASLADIHQGPDVHRLWMELRSDRNRPTFEPEPRPRRDLEPRRKCLQRLDAVQSDPDLQDPEPTPPELAWDPKVFDDVRSLLGSTEETIAASGIQSLDALAERLRAVKRRIPNDESESVERVGSDSSDRASTREAVASALTELALTERKPHPAKQVTDSLSGRLPSIAWFGESDRALQSDYIVSTVATNMPPALEHLCAMGELDIREVSADLSNGRIPHVEKRFEVANRLLKDRFQSTWTQSAVYPRLSTPSDGVLRVMISTEDDEDYSYPAERSDGLRWFIALHAFIAARGQQQPVVIVDEAETHLHYDAQADLIDALMSQRLASKVVYTTHSVGCLPPDLGTGIRAVLAERGAERSRIANSYWSVTPDDEERVGYAPLIFAMGARMLSLTIPRYGVVAEGPSDALLLPTLFREVAQLRTLPYRVVPGLSELARSETMTVDHHAGKIACLTDDDDAGKDIRRRLRDGGLPEDRLLHLGKIAPGCTLEDLISATVFAHAVNSELETWSIGRERVDPAQVPITARWSWLEAWGEETATPIARLSKPRVAQRVVDSGRPNRFEDILPQLVAPDHVKPLRTLHETILAALGINSTQ
jgi:hypothetical protein